MTAAPQPTHLEEGQFFGKHRLERRVAGLLLHETHYSGGQSAPPHEHPLPYFAFLIEGGYLEQWGRRPVSFAPRSFVFHPAHEVHFGSVGEEGARLLHVEIAPLLIDQLHDERRLPDESVDRRSGPLPSLSQHLYRELGHTDAASELVIEGIALEILGELVRAAARAEDRPRWLERARELVHAEPSRALTVQSVAAEVGVGAVRLSRAFRQVFGESLGSYQRRLRVEKACEHLRDGELSLAQIALAAGFTDQSHFTRIFRRLTGTTPGAFRHAATGARQRVG